MFYGRRIYGRRNKLDLTDIAILRLSSTTASTQSHFREGMIDSRAMRQLCNATSWEEGLRPTRVESFERPAEIVGGPLSEDWMRGDWPGGLSLELQSI